MKKHLLVCIALAGGAHVFSQSLPFFDPATEEDKFPTNQYWDWQNPKQWNSHSCANGYSGYSAEWGGETDIYTYSWDEWQAGSTTSLHLAGFAVRECKFGEPVNWGGPPTLAEANINLGDINTVGQNGQTVSVESTVIKDKANPDNTFIVVTYYRDAIAAGFLPGFYIELYSWSNGNLNLVSAHELSQPFFGNVGKGIIHQDVNSAEIGVLAFEVNGKIFSQTFRVDNGNLLFSGLGEVFSPDIPYTFANPDVAIMLNQSSGNRSLFYTMKSITGQSLCVLKGDFAELDAFPPGTINIWGIERRDNVFIWDVLYANVPSFNPNSNYGVTFDLPRIDAPDISDFDEVWSWVVTENGHGLEFVRSGYYNSDVSPNVLYHYMNFTVFFPTFWTFNDPMMNDTTYNKRAVVSFGRDEEVYYAWAYGEANPYQNVMIYPGISNASPIVYLSRKFDRYGNCLNDFPTSYPYNTEFGFEKINRDPYHAGAMSSVALSTYNRNNKYMFTSFLMNRLNGKTDFYIGNKTTDLSSAKFKPGLNDQTITVNETLFFPNPFQSSVSMRSSDAGEQYLAIFDCFGKLVFEESGTAEVLNKQFNHFSLTLPAGAYFASVTKDGTTKTTKIVKYKSL